MAERRSPPRAGLAGLLLAAALLHAGRAEGQSWRTMTSARQLTDGAPVSVQVEYGAGRLTLGAADEPMLYRMELRYDDDHFSPITAYDAAERTLRLGVRGREGSGVHLKEGARAKIGLSSAVPLDLKLHFGAGEADLELGGLQLRSVDVATGASETRIGFGAANRVQAGRVHIRSGAAELKVYGLGNARAERFDFEGGVGSTLLDFGGEWTRSAEARVRMGLGSVTLRLPRGIGVRIDRSSFLTSFEADGMVKRDGSYFSRNWDDAPHRLTIAIDAALGSIEVDWID